VVAVPDVSHAAEMTSGVTQSTIVTGLPHRLSTFVGRAAERAEVAVRLEETRLLTLTGVGGCGKTSLGLEVARDVGTRFPGGIFWVELASISDPALVALALAHGVGVQPLPGETDLDATAAVLAERRTLVVLDNCEHVIEGCAEVVQGLLRRCGATTVLATSRAPLRVDGETEWRVPSLSLPRGVDGLGDVEAALESDSVRLFVDRARRIQTGFSCDEKTVEPVVEICQRLDGIPLAIELAAGRLRLLSVEQIARGLDDALSVVVGSPRMTSPRQRTLRASIDWSYDLLRPAERLLLRQLGVFVDGFTLELAHAVCVAEEPPVDALFDVLAGLVEQSLVQVVESVGTPRYRLLDTVRQYALARLDDAGELAGALDRHADAMLELAERQYDDVGGAHVADALTTIDAEAPNLLAAIDHAVASRPEQAQRLCIALGSWFRHRGRLREGVRSCEAALADEGGSAVLRAKTLHVQAFLLGVQGDFAGCIALATEAHRVADDAGDEGAALQALLTAANFRMFTDPPAAARDLESCLELGLRRQDDWVATRSAVLLATVAWFQQDLERCDDWVESHWDRIAMVGDRQTLALARLAQGGSRYATLDHAQATALLEEAIAAAREVGDPLAEGTPRVVLCLIRMASGEPEGALEEVRGLRRRLLTHGQFYFLAWATLTEAIALAASGDLPSSRLTLQAIVAGELPGPRHGVTWAQLELSEVLRLIGDAEGARKYAVSALAAAEMLGNQWYATKARLTLGRLLARSSDWREAERLHHAALAAIVEGGLALELASAFEALAEVAVGMGAFDEAARLLGAATRRRGERGPSPWPAHLAEVHVLLDRIRQAIGKADLERAFAAGEAFTDQEVVAWIRRGRGPRRRPVAGWDSLTPAELEVVRYAAAGLTNPEIAEKLFIARATVKAHLAHVYAKLEVNNRTELAALSAQRLQQ
jgi:predicted ATPase/DNA-binding CsgD family transcriptional regulator